MKLHITEAGLRNEKGQCVCIVNSPEAAEEIVRAVNSCVELECQNAALRELVVTALAYFVADVPHKESWFIRARAALEAK